MELEDKAGHKKWFLKKMYRNLMCCCTKLQNNIKSIKLENSARKRNVNLMEEQMNKKKKNHDFK